MRNIKLTIEYDGTHFKGWQLQKPSSRTVQGELLKACAQIFGTKVVLIGSGRTDSGVHALGQVANFKTRSSMPTDEMLRALNAILPEDIAILEAKDVPADFHAQFSVKKKTYRYALLTRPIRAAQERYFCTLYPYRLNIARMRTEAKTLVGKHDFKSFQANDPRRNKKNTIRTISKLIIRKKGDYLFIDIEANGFLYKMVRNIVGTLLEAGAGRIPPGNVKTILKAQSRTLAGKTAPAKGLCLVKVDY
jgi:tRNA pseudouridine38-40 synthase